MSEEKKSWKFIPLEEVPPHTRMGFYTDVIDDFVRSGHGIAKLDYSRFKSSNVTSIVYSLRRAAKAKARVMKRGKDIILLRLSRYE